MKATIGKTVSNAINYGNKKEMICTYNVVTNTLKELITVRCYMGRSANVSTVYASIWVHGDIYTSGMGKAGGGGYHKTSAAIGNAIESAGIALDQDIWGVGEGAIHEALKAIAEALGFSNVLIVEN